MLSCQERCRVVFVLWIPCGLTAPLGFDFVGADDVAVGSRNGAAIASIARRNENTSLPWSHEGVPSIAVKLRTKL